MLVSWPIGGSVWVLFSLLWQYKVSGFELLHVTGLIAALLVVLRSVGGHLGKEMVVLVKLSSTFAYPLFAAP